MFATLGIAGEQFAQVSLGDLVVVLGEREPGRTGSQLLGRALRFLRHSNITTRRRRPCARRWAADQQDSL
jgi:hypothetical protein